MRLVFTLLENGAEVNFPPHGGLSPIGETAWAVRQGIFIEKGEDDAAVAIIWYQHAPSSTAFFKQFFYY